MALSPKGCAYGNEPRDTRSIAQVIEPCRTGSSSVESQQQGVMVEKPLLGTGFVVAMEAALLPQHRTPYIMVALPVGHAGDAKEGMCHLVRPVPHRPLFAAWVPAKKVLFGLGLSVLLRVYLVWLVFHKIEKFENVQPSTSS